MSAFFPLLPPRKTGRLTLEDGAELVWERHGNRSGTPLLFLHGGPGSGVSDKQRRMFDPNRFDIILFDQRGAGRSRPVLDLERNTTTQLVDDIEALRLHLGVETWIVGGGSWGSTLALGYAQTHPQRVRALALTAVFLGRAQELGWWHDPQGAPRFYPQAYATFLEPVPLVHRASALSIMDWYYWAMRSELSKFPDRIRRLADPACTLEAARDSLLYRWTEYEDHLSYLTISEAEVFDGIKRAGPDFTTAHSLIEAHYFVEGCFMDENQLIEDAGRLAAIPMAILHSKQDMVCPPQAAVDLARVCPHARLELVDAHGHALTEQIQPLWREMLADLADQVEGSNTR